MADSYAAVAVRSHRITGAAIIGDVAMGAKLKKKMEKGKEIGKAVFFRKSRRWSVDRTFL